MGYLRRVLGVTLRDKERRSEIRKARDVKPLLRIERSKLCQFSHVSRTSQEKNGELSPLSYSLHPQESGLTFVQGPGLYLRPWSRLGVEPAVLSEIAVDRDVFRVLLGLLPPRLSPKEKRARKWVNEWVCMPTYLNLAIHEIVFSLFAKSECRIQIIKHI